MSDQIEKPKHPGVVPYLLSPSCDEHIEWLKDVFGAKQFELYRTEGEAKIMHATMAINDGILYLAADDYNQSDEEKSESKIEVEDLRGFWLHVELDDPKVVWNKAIASKAAVVFDLDPKKEHKGGELACCFRDPFGFYWGIVLAGERRQPGVAPYLFLPDSTECEKYIKWMQKNLGAKKDVTRYSDGCTEHWALEMNGVVVYIANLSGMCKETREILEGKPKRFFCHMEKTDAQAFWDSALKEGAKATMEFKVQSYGGEYGMFKDPFDFEWGVLAKAASPEKIPAGVIPYLSSPDCEKHIDWMKSVFDVEVTSIYHASDSKKVMHCSLKINDGTLYMADGACTNEFKDRLDGPPRGFTNHLNVADPDSIWKKAMANGATETMELKIQFWGDYYGAFKDPYGFEWAVMKA